MGPQTSLGMGLAPYMGLREIFCSNVFCRDSKMPPRKKSRVTSVVLPEMSKPSVFNALCLPNTGFMVDFLGFFTRDDFEKYLQLTCKRMNQLILTHFHSKPYRYLDNVTLMCNLVRNMELSLSKLAANSASTIIWDPYQRKWRRSRNYEIGFSKMLQFLDMSVRVPKVNIGLISTVMTQEIIDQLKSLSHIWENAQVEFSTGICMKENLVSVSKFRADQLNEAKLFHCRRLKCLCWNVMLPLWEYPELYSLEVAEFDFAYTESEEFDFAYTESEECDPKTIIQLVENQALYPHSQTTFVFSEAKYRICPLFTKTVLQHICNKLMESDKAQSFRIVFAVNERFELSDGEMDEIRVENNRIREILHLRCVNHNEVSEYCEFDRKTTYFILERSLI
ncbi:hypothetical protein Ddc_21167 [Ditylenchus destructor]|nr:hypothetical protein Ddc_21167 [Ditylenchus destructor]